MPPQWLPTSVPLQWVVLTGCSTPVVAPLPFSTHTSFRCATTWPPRSIPPVGIANHHLHHCSQGAPPRGRPTPYPQWVLLIIIITIASHGAPTPVGISCALRGACACSSGSTQGSPPKPRLHFSTSNQSLQLFQISAPTVSDSSLNHLQSQSPLIIPISLAGLPDDQIRPLRGANY